jgi:hypothetical protein
MIQKGDLSAIAATALMPRTERMLAGRTTISTPSVSAVEAAISPRSAGADSIAPRLKLPAACSRVWASTGMTPRSRGANRLR